MKSKMLENFGGINQQALKKKLENAQVAIQKISEEVESKDYTGTAGGNAVEVVISGNKEIVKILVHDKTLTEDSSKKDMLLDLIIVAHKEACKLADEDVDERIAEVTEGLPIAR